MMIVEQLESFLLLIDNLGGNAKPLLFAPPASDSEIQELELKLGYRMPEDFRNILLTISSHCEFKWFLPDDFELLPPIHQIFSGELHWGIEFILSFNESREGWIREVFSNPADEYDKVWYNKLIFQEVGNGDFIAIDLLPDSYGKIIYLSHDDGEGHGYVIANSFSELLHKWVELGCTGGEDWQWLPFCEDKFTGINPNSKNALVWKQAIGLI
ncbi:SMI1/KNR4 family protein [Hymenobacter norwichensis]|uniref:SMI1/KNR4 family protein n=1 Tax=Hymenobacter norwichensis TaxID=223903 RepID=UPI0003B37B5E|nr:SMI1/KNR4 family protein [Hymenobacter norwichensis]